MRGLFVAILGNLDGVFPSILASVKRLVYVWRQHASNRNTGQYKICLRM